MKELNDQLFYQMEARTRIKTRDLLAQLFPHQGFPHRDDAGVLRRGHGRAIEDRPMSEKIARLELMNDVVEAQQVLRLRVIELLAYHPDAEPRLPYLYAVGDILGAERLRDSTPLWNAMRKGDWHTVGVELLACNWDKYYGVTPSKKRAVVGLALAVSSGNTPVTLQ